MDSSEIPKEEFRTVLEQWFSKYSSRTSSINLIQELVRHILGPNPKTDPENLRPTDDVLTSPPGDYDAHSSLRITSLDEGLWAPYEEDGLGSSML